MHIYLSVRLLIPGLSEIWKAAWIQLEQLILCLLILREWWLLASDMETHAVCNLCKALKSMFSLMILIASRWSNWTVSMSFMLHEIWCRYFTHLLIVTAWEIEILESRLLCFLQDELVINCMNTYIHLEPISTTLLLNLRWVNLGLICTDRIL